MVTDQQRPKPSSSGGGAHWAGGVGRQLDDGAFTGRFSSPSVTSLRTGDSSPGGWSLWRKDGAFRIPQGIPFERPLAGPQKGIKPAQPPWPIRKGHGGVNYLQARLKRQKIRPTPYGVGLCTQ